MKYAVKIVMPSGAIISAVVSKQALRSINLKACSSISFQKIKE
jgi:molybdopterin-binding protein